MVNFLSQCYPTKEDIYLVQLSRKPFTTSASTSARELELEASVKVKLQKDYYKQNRRNHRSQELQQQKVQE